MNCVPRGQHPRTGPPAPQRRPARNCYHRPMEVILASTQRSGWTQLLAEVGRLRALGWVNMRIELQVENAAD